MTSDSLKSLTLTLWQANLIFYNYLRNEKMLNLGIKIRDNKNRERVETDAPVCKQNVATIYAYIHLWFIWTYNT